MILLATAITGLGLKKVSWLFCLCNHSVHMLKHVQVTMSSVLDKELDHESVKIVEDVVHPKNVSSSEVRKYMHGF